MLHRPLMALLVGLAASLQASEVPLALIPQPVQVIRGEGMTPPLTTLHAQGGPAVEAVAQRLAEILQRLTGTAPTVAIGAGAACRPPRP